MGVVILPFCTCDDIHVENKEECHQFILAKCDSMYVVYGPRNVSCGGARSGQVSDSRILCACGLIVCVYVCVRETIKWRANRFMPRQETCFSIKSVWNRKTRYVKCVAGAQHCFTVWNWNVRRRTPVAHTTPQYQQFQRRPQHPLGGKTPECPPPAAAAHRPLSAFQHARDHFWHDHPEVAVVSRARC